MITLRYYLLQPGKNAQRTKSILVVDDEYDINLTLEYVLNKSSFKVSYSFTNPLIALESVKPGLYDLAISDVKMPVMNSFSLYNEIRKVDHQNLFLDTGMIEILKHHTSLVWHGRLT